MCVNSESSNLEDTNFSPAASAAVVFYATSCCVIMDQMDLGDMGSGCEDENCGPAVGFLENCSNQECQWEEPMFGLIELGR